MTAASEFYGGGGDPAYWASGATYAQGKSVRSPADHQRYVRIVAGAGTTDPSADSTNWRPDGGRAIKSIQRGTIAQAPSGGSTATATVSSVNTAKAELRLLGSSAGGTANGSFARIALTNSTTVTATRQTQDDDTNASWELTEYY